MFDIINDLQKIILILSFKVFFCLYYISCLDDCRLNKKYNLKLNQNRFYLVLAKHFFQIL